MAAATPTKAPPMSAGLETWRDPEQVTMQWREESLLLTQSNSDSKVVYQAVYSLH